MSTSTNSLFWRLSVQIAAIKLITIRSDVPRLSQSCYICQKHRYTVVFCDLKHIDQYFQEVTQPEVLSYLRQQYRVEEVCLRSDDKAPFVMGSVTDYKVMQMCSIGGFNHFSRSTLQEDRQALINLICGIKDKFGMKLLQENSKDWRDRFLEKLKYPVADVALVNLPPKIEQVDGVSAEELRRYVDDTQLNVFVFAAFLKPGKHQIILYDQQSGKFWVKNFVVQMRRSEVA